MLHWQKLEAVSHKLSILNVPHSSLQGFQSNLRLSWLKIRSGLLWKCAQWLPTPTDPGALATQRCQAWLAPCTFCLRTSPGALAEPFPVGPRQALPHPCEPPATRG